MIKGILFGGLTYIIIMSLTIIYLYDNKPWVLKLKEFKPKKEK